MSEVAYLDMNEHQKFIHLLWSPELKFSTKIVLLINTPENGFCSEDHVFVTPFKNVYEALCEHPNVKFIDLEKPRSAELINVCAPLCDWMIIHNMCKPLELRKVKKENFKKIVWRTWGNDAGYIYQQRQPLRNLVKAMINGWTKKYYRSVFAVGYANIVDIFDIKKKYGEMPMYCLPYSKNGNYALLSGIREGMQSTGKKDDVTRVVIGHFGFLDDNQLQAIDYVKRFVNENVEFYFPMSYGDPKCIARIKEYATKALGDKAIFVEKFMPYDEYARFISGMDIGILNGTRSGALGNVSLLAFFDKKLYLHRKGIIKEAFDSEHAPSACVDEIKKMSFEEFKRPFSYDREVFKEFVVKDDIRKSLQGWHDLFAMLEESNQKRK